VGLPNVGKSTLFNALTKNNVLAANYPFATIEPNVGIVGVPDVRLEKLHDLYPTSKVIPASVTFVDIAGIVRGASEGQGLGNKFLANIRESDAIVQVVRAFSGDVVHVDDSVHPGRDIETINTELILADLQTLTSRIAKTKPANTSLVKAQSILDGGQTLYAAGYDHEDLHELNLLTSKPFLYVFNVDESDLQNEVLQKEMRDLVAPADAVFACAKLEAELSELDDAEALELLSEYGQNESGLSQLIKAGYSLLGLQTYLTAGPKEVRAWTIHQGFTAPQAAGVIHTDFEKGFIKAQVINYDDLIATGSETAAKAAGKLRLEGKDYVMQEGDVVEFRFNV
jgi:hypothetical protein